MTIRIGDLKVGLNENQDKCYELALSAAGVSPDRVKKMWIAKRSVDARKRENISFIYTVGLELEGEEDIAPGPNIRLDAQEAYVLSPGAGAVPPGHRPVIAGFGPGGMFCGLILARMGYRPIILERGPEMDKRVKLVEGFYAGGPLSELGNVQFGEGGAGTFSDGKLTTRIGDPRCSFILKELVGFGAPEETLWEARPHIGTDRLREVVTALRREIISLGGEVRFETPLEQIVVKGGRVCGVVAGGTAIPADCLVVAVGHSARDTFAMLEGLPLPMEAKAFSVGARLEHRQELIDRGLYGRFAGHPLLPKGEYQLSHRDGEGRAVYTFCMCPGGVVVPAASSRESVVTNGMSSYLRDGENANGGLVVSVDARDFGAGPQKAIAFQREIEERAWSVSQSYRAPAQTVDRFLEGKAGYKLGSVRPSYPIGVVPGDFDALFPQAVARRMREGLRIFGRRLPGFDGGDGVLTAPETRTSSPIRILRNDALESPGAAGLYPCGEGAGYAGGIMSAAADGIRVAEKIAGKYGSGQTALIIR